MEPGDKNNRKRNPFVEKPAQSYLSFLLLLYFMIYTCIMLIAILLPSSIKFNISSVPIAQQFEAGREFLFLDQRVVPVVLSVILVMSIHFLFLTHRIFGPLKRLRRLLAGWAEGEWPPHFSYRKRDFHDQPLDTFNHSFEKVRKDLLAAKTQVSRAAETAAAAAGKNDTEARAALVSAEEDCRRAIKVLEKYIPGDREKE